MGTIGFPESVLRSMPLLVCTSNMGLRLLKKAGFPQPACTGQSHMSTRHKQMQPLYKPNSSEPGMCLCAAACLTIVQSAFSRSNQK